MSNKFAFEIVALDRFSKMFRSLNNSASKALRPVAQAQRQMGALAREMHLDKISKGFRGAAQSAQRLASNLGLSAAPIEAIAGLGAAGGLVAAAAAVAALATRFGNLGFGVSQASKMIGVSTEDLQKYQGAAKLAGVSQEALTSGFGNLGRTLQDAEFGRNPEAYAALNKFGIGIKRNKAGVVDTVETFKDMSRVISQITSPQVQEKVADIFGMRELLPLLRQGPDAMDKLAESAKRMGLVFGDKQIKDAENYAAAMRELDSALTGMANRLGSSTAPMLTRAITSMNKALEGGLWGGVWNVLSGQVTRDAAFGGAAPGQQRSSGVVTGGAAAPQGGPLPLGLRQNNPGNLRSWVGAGQSNGFASFNTAQDGLNAMAQQIGLYGNRDGLRSISSIIGKYAPSSENNTGAYINAVSKDTGFDSNAQLNTNDPKVLAPLLSAMVKHEQGRQPFNGDEYAKAAQTVKVEVAFANAPPGTKAKADAGGSWAPTRVSYAMPNGTNP